MAIAYNEFVIRVYAIDIRRGVEGSQFGQIRVINPPPVMGRITANSWIGGALFTWPRNHETDFVGYKIKSWLSNEAGYIGGSQTIETTANSYQRGFSEAEKNGGFSIVNISVTAIDTFGQESEPQTAVATIEGLNIKPTDITGFALKASQMFSTAIALEGEQFFNNSANQGESFRQGWISWNAHKVFVRGVEFNIVAGGTDKKFIYFYTSRVTWPTYEEFQSKDYVAPVESNISYGTSDQHPADIGLISMNFAGNYGQIVAVNNEGYYDLAWSAVANQIIGSAYIMNGAINDAHIGTLTAGKITAGSAFVGGVSIGGMTTLDISLGATGEVPTVSSYLPEGLYITRDFIGYYNGIVQNGVSVPNGQGIIKLSKDSKMVVGEGTNFSASSIPGTGSTIRICIPVPQDGSGALYGNITFSRSSGIKSGVSIELSANSPVSYEGRYALVDTSASVVASNEWSYLLKTDGTIAVKEGGQIVVGNKNIVMNSAAGTNSIEIAPDGGKAGHDYIEMKDGNVKEFFFNGSTHVQMKSLKNIVVGTCISGQQCTINGNFKSAPTVLIMAPEAMSSHNDYSHMPFKIIARPGTVSLISGTQYKFTPQIGIEYISGGIGYRPVGNISFVYSGADASIETGSVTVVPGTTGAEITVQLQCDINSDLTAKLELKITAQYYNGSSWSDGNYISEDFYNLVNYGRAIQCTNSGGMSAVRLKIERLSGLTASQIRGTIISVGTVLGNAYFYENNSQAQYIAFGVNE